MTDKREAQNNRLTLKGFFKRGSLPTEENFASLIDSTLNIKDDCFDWNESDGVEIRLRSPKRRFMSFFGSASEKTPDWSVTAGESGGTLQVSRVVTADGAATTPATDPPVITVAYDGAKGGLVGIGQTAPDETLDVSGNVKSTGRCGVAVKGISADGEWHSITRTLTGCQAFEVMAGVGMPGQARGRYALLRAVAMNTFNPSGFFFNFLRFKNRIRCQHAWYRSRTDRLQLKWSVVSADDFTYTLQIRTSRDYGYGVEISVLLTRLWFDPMVANRNNEEKFWYEPPGQKGART